MKSNEEEQHAVFFIPHSFHLNFFFASRKSFNYFLFLIIKLLLFYWHRKKKVNVATKTGVNRLPRIDLLYWNINWSKRNNYLKKRNMQLDTNSFCNLGHNKRQNCKLLLSPFSLSFMLMREKKICWYSWIVCLIIDGILDCVICVQGSAWT